MKGSPQMEIDLPTERRSLEADSEVNKIKILFTWEEGKTAVLVGTALSGVSEAIPAYLWTIVPIPRRSCGIF